MNHPETQKEYLPYLKSHWGKGFHLYDYQTEIIDALLTPKDTLALLPTGAGKSLCFQLAGLALKGLTLVISPLLALMADQVQSLKEKELPAAYFSAQMSVKAQEAILKSTRKSPSFFLYLSPEQLLKPALIAFFKQHPPHLIVIDEAHCISLWGHEFRPAYRQIPQFIKHLHERPIIAAFTATAPPDIEKDIISELQLKSPFIHRATPLGKHISIQVKGVWTPRGKWRCLRQALTEKTLIYVTTRREAETLSKQLSKDIEIPVQHYHAGLSTEAKADTFKTFKAKGTQVMIATKAFGMGIDISDIRQVIHWQTPDSLESYVQEVGRAGRDRQAAKTLLLTQWKEASANTFFEKSLVLEKSLLDALIKQLQKDPSVYRLQDRYTLSPNLLQLVLGRLEKKEVFKQSRPHEYQQLRAPTAQDKKDILNFLNTLRHKKQKQTKIMRAFIKTKQCRFIFLEHYFGHRAPTNCGLCDNCL